MWPFQVSARIEKDKSLFGGVEITGKTLGVIGLGQIGGRVVNAALDLGMSVVGYDPVLSLDAAWMLPGDRMSRAKDLDELLKASDYISVHVPYIKGENGTHHMLNAENMKLCKRNVHLLNFARGEIIDGEAVKKLFDSGAMTGKYVSDFSDPFLMGHPRHVVLPHLGASTEEAEENSAAMAADTIKNFLLTGGLLRCCNHNPGLPIASSKLDRNHLLSTMAFPSGPSPKFMSPQTLFLTLHVLLLILTVAFFLQAPFGTRSTSLPSPWQLWIHRSVVGYALSTRMTPVCSVASPPSSEIWASTSCNK